MISLLASGSHGQKTSGLNVGPQYEYSSGKQTITGYQATKSAGTGIAARAAGGNSTEISGLSTDLQNDSALLDGLLPFGQHPKQSD